MTGWLFVLFSSTIS